jgi:hypothetical protein
MIPMKISWKREVGTHFPVDTLFIDIVHRLREKLGEALRSLVANFMGFM